MKGEKQHSLVSIPGGTYHMGENKDDKYTGDTERPRHPVRIEAFSLGRTPVTIGQYRLFCPQHESQLPPQWPVSKVSWQDAQDYCQWLGPSYRLPSEAEWEYAARAGSQTPYPHGDTLHPHQANYYYDEQGRKVGPGQRTPVGQYPANHFGLYDMLGNICEWVQDSWQDNYQQAPLDGQAVPTEHPQKLRVLRGGAWDYMPRLLRTTWRDSLPQHKHRDNLGFRIASSHP